ncbi:MAG: response regulator [Methylococcales bacterium]
MPNNPTEKPILLLASFEDTGTAIMQQYLRRREQRVTVTDQASEIVDLINQHQFGLILFDIQLSGFELVKQVKQQNEPVKNNTPLIALINYTDPGLRRLVITAGFDDYLLKPVDLDMLTEILDVWHTDKQNTGAMDYVSMLLSKTHNDHKIAAIVFQKLFLEMPTQISDIASALENQQYELAQQISHKLHGSVSLCGFTDLRLSARALEGSLLDKDYDNAGKNFLNLQQSTKQFTNHRQTIMAYFGQ